MKSTAVSAVLLASFLLAGASCEKRPDPPSAVEVDRVVEVACRIPEPQCSAPGYNAAKKEQEGDVKLRLLRAEVIEQEDCLRLYRKALEACRTLPAK